MNKLIIILGILLQCLIISAKFTFAKNPNFNLSKSKYYQYIAENIYNINVELPFTLFRSSDPVNCLTHNIRNNTLTFDYENPNKCDTNDDSHVFYLIINGIIIGDDGSELYSFEIVSLIYDNNLKKYKVYALQAIKDPITAVVGILHGKVVMKSAPTFRHLQSRTYSWFFVLHHLSTEEGKNDYTDIIAKHERERLSENCHFLRIMNVKDNSAMVSGPTQVRMANGTKYEICSRTDLCHIGDVYRYPTIFKNYATAFFLAKNRHLQHAIVDEDNYLTNYNTEINYVEPN